MNLPCEIWGGKIDILAPGNDLQSLFQYLRNNHDTSDAGGRDNIIPISSWKY